MTVLTPVRNGQRYLSEAIDSIRAQTFTDWEYVIVDDASDDATVQIVETAMRADDRIRLIRRTSGGDPYAASNEGLARARGRYVVYLDSDDIAEPDRIERQLSYLDARPHLRACAGRPRYLQRAARLRRSLSNWPVGPPPKASRWHLCVRRNLLHSSACVERSAYEEIGGYREGVLHSDFRMWCELARRQWLGFVPAVVVSKRLHTGQLTRRAARDELIEPVLDALGEHVTAVTGDRWDRREIAALHDLQRRAGSRSRESYRVLRRWEHAWQADDALGAEDRRYLTRLGRAMRARVNVVRWPLVRRQPAYRR